MVILKDRYKTIQEIDTHEHSFFLFSNEAEFFHCAVPFIREGIKRNQKCFFIVDSLTKEDIFRHFSTVFREGMIPVDVFTNEKNIIIKKVKDLFSFGSVIDVKKAESKVQELIEKSMYEGYSGIRIIVEASKNIAINNSVEKLISYESLIKELTANNNLTVVSSYDKNHFNINELKSICNVHSSEIDLIRTRL